MVVECNFFKILRCLFQPPGRRAHREGHFSDLQRGAFGARVAEGFWSLEVEYSWKNATLVNEMLIYLSAICVEYFDFELFKWGKQWYSWFFSTDLMLLVHCFDGHLLLTSSRRVAEAPHLSKLAKAPLSQAEKLTHFWSPRQWQKPKWQRKDWYV